MRNYEGTCKGICRYNLVYKFLIQLLPLISSVFAVHFSNAFWHGNKTFPKVSSLNEIVPVLVIVHLPHSKYRGVKTCFTRVVIKIKIFHSCRTRVVSVTLVSLVSGTRVDNQTISIIETSVLHNLRYLSLEKDFLRQFIIKFSSDVQKTVCDRVLFEQSCDCNPAIFLKIKSFTDNV